MSAIASQQDPRTIATYDFSEAARYLHLPVSTLRAWVRGQDKFESLIAPAADARPMLSFFNLVEIHLLAAIRRSYRVPMANVRQALKTLNSSGDDHPLISKMILTDGVDLFVREYGEILNISQPNQRVMNQIIDAYLKRVEWEQDSPIVLFPFPFNASDISDARKSVMIDPRISFGRLVVAGTGIPAEIITERFHAGESVDQLAKDYRLDRLAIEDVLRFEPALAA